MSGQYCLVEPCYSELLYGKNVDLVNTGHGPANNIMHRFECGRSIRADAAAEVFVSLTGCKWSSIVVWHNSTRDRTCGLLPVDRVKKEADRMHETGDHEAAYTMLLTHKESSDPELLWRLARATFKLHEFGAQKEKSLVEGLTYLDRAVGAGGAELGPVHKVPRADLVQGERKMKK